MNTTQNIQATPNPTVLAQALHSANVAQIMKESAPVPRIVLKKDLLGNTVVFDVDSHNREANTVAFWSAGKEKKWTTAPMDFYRSTKDIKDDAERIKLVTDFGKVFGVKEMVVRKRLEKETFALKKNAAIKTEGESQEDVNRAFAEKIIAAITKAVNEALGVE